MVGIDCNNVECVNPHCTCDPCDCTPNNLCECCRQGFALEDAIKYLEA